MNEKNWVESLGLCVFCQMFKGGAPQELNEMQNVIYQK
jgi:hypothetical protein